eukprot:jgi/Chlat1/4312/Chrsp29S00343
MAELATNSPRARFLRSKTIGSYGPGEAQVDMLVVEPHSVTNHKSSDHKHSHHSDSGRSRFAPARFQWRVPTSVLAGAPLLLLWGVFMIGVHLGRDLQHTSVEMPAAPIPRRMLQDQSPGDPANPFDSDVMATVASMTPCQKVGQMILLNVDAVIYNDAASPRGFEFNATAATILLSQPYCIGGFFGAPNVANTGWPTSAAWRYLLQNLQSVATSVESKTPVLFFYDALHGANGVVDATLWPMQTNIAATFNVTVSNLNGQMVAKDHGASYIKWMIAPTCTIAVHPGWARFQHTFGEDPYLTGEMARAFVTGAKGASLTAATSNGATVAHWIGGGAAKAGHDRWPAMLPMQTLQQYHVPPYSAAISAGAGAVELGYSEINGQPVTLSKQYTTNILRNQLKFNGPVIAEYAEANSYFIRFHKVAANASDAARLTMQSSTVDMMVVGSDRTVGGYILDLIAAGVVPQSRIDTSVGRILQLKKNLGLLTGTGLPTPSAAQINSVGSGADRKTVLDAVRQSIVLLRNNVVSGTTKPMLPLALATKVLVVGPTGNSLTYQSGPWTFSATGAPSESSFTYGSTIFQAMAALGGAANVKYQQGCAIDGSNLDIAGANAAASSAAAIIVCLGEAPYFEIGGNINALELPDGQLQLVASMIATGKPVAVVLIEGRPRLTAGQTDGALAVLQAGVPGPDGGEAIAEVLYGIINPSGRLPYTYPRNSVEVAVPYYHKVYENTCVPGPTGALANCPVEFAFGTGLSYTTWVVSNPVVTPTAINVGGTVTVSFTVKNTGTRTGSFVVLLYINQGTRSAVTPEVSMLRRFSRLADVTAGKIISVSFTLFFADMSYYNPDTNTVVLEPGTFFVRVGGSNTAASFTVS